MDGLAEIGQHDSRNPIMQLSSLKFAPLGRTPTTNKRNPIDDVPEDTMDRRQRQLTSQLQTLVQSHQDCLFTGSGDLSAIRRFILDTMHELQNVHDETVTLGRDQVVELLGDREDATLVSDEIDELTETEKTIEESRKDVDEGLLLINDEIAELERKLESLKIKQAELRRIKQNREKDRVERLNSVRNRLKVLRQRPTKESCNAAIQELNERIDDSTIEADALLCGSKVLESIIRQVCSFEGEIKESLGNGDVEAAKRNLNEAIQYLRDQFETVKESGWKLLQAVIGAERDAYTLALEMLCDSTSIDCGRIDVHPNSPAD